jgi:hypothetical protein
MAIFNSKLLVDQRVYTHFVAVRMPCFVSCGGHQDGSDRGANATPRGAAISTNKGGRLCVLEREQRKGP